MDKVRNARRGWRLVVAAAALAAVTAGCGSETDPPAQDFPTVEPTTERDVPTPSIDTRKCADSAAQARAEHRSICVD
jgi:hypothetical protein